MSDEKRHKNQELTIYRSLIFAAGMMAVSILMLIADDYGLPLFYAAFYLLPLVFLAFGAILVISVIGLFKGSWLLRRHLLLWYACSFTLILIVESIVSPNLADNILILGIVILFVLLVIWVRNASRS